MILWHLQVGWGAILVGLLAGAAIGLRFHRSAWLGGYAAWPRRLVRLGHISLVALGVLNCCFAAALPHARPGPHLGWASGLLVAGTAAMPVCCFAAAYAPRTRHAFAVPVCCLVGAVSALFFGGLLG